MMVITLSLFDGWREKKSWLLGCYVALMRGGKNGPASNVTVIFEVLADARRATPSMIVRTEPMTNAKNLILTLRLHNFPFSPTTRGFVSFEPNNNNNNMTNVHYGV